MRHSSSLVLWAIIFLAHAGAAGTGEVGKELEGIQKKIESEKRGIARVKKHEGSVLAALAKIETELEQKNHALKQIEGRLDAYGANLRKTEAELKKINASLAARNDLLRRRLRALYKWERGGSAAVLLGGDLSLPALVRGRRYLQKTLARDQEMLLQYREELEHHNRLRAEVAHRTSQLNGERQALVKVKESIHAEREKKQEILAALKKEKDLHRQALKELELAAHRLQKMLDEMSRNARARPAPSGPGFEGKKGALDYPVRGEIVGSFGKTKHPDFEAEMFRKGVDIEAPLGEQVKVVEAGSVIFADHFPGYGKMMIVDHGQRYYTIYGHLDEMKKRVGEAVKKGETIASVGDSDSLRGPRLYFEIRKDGKPVDPVAWLRKR